MAKILRLTAGAEPVDLRGIIAGMAMGALQVFDKTHSLSI
jgi:hypothetical protein